MRSGCAIPVERLPVLQEPVYWNEAPSMQSIGHRFLRHRRAARRVRRPRRWPSGQGRLRPASAGGGIARWPDSRFVRSRYDANRWLPRV